MKQLPFIQMILSNTMLRQWTISKNMHLMSNFQKNLQFIFKIPRLAKQNKNSLFQIVRNMKAAFVMMVVPQVITIVSLMKMNQNYIEVLLLMIADKNYIIQKLLYQIIMDFRTPKCSHNEKGRCINCLTKQIKSQKKVQAIVQQKVQCKHPPNMKCLKCLPTKDNVNKCNHQEFEKCAKCQNLSNYQQFQYFLKKLQMNCTHKKPCNRCLPFQSRKTYSIDKTCRNHLPFPQALCESCIAPTVTLRKQQYSHVKKVIIKTMSVYKIIDAGYFGILLGNQKNGIIEVQEVYFPKHQIKQSNFINPEQVSGQFSSIFQTLGYKQVGFIYSSENITPLALMISSLFQQRHADYQYQHQISKFITMRLHHNKQEGTQYFECFMVSDQFQTFHKHNLIYQKSNGKNSFDLVTTKSQGNSEIPTFLREGVQTDEYYFKEIIVWIQTISEQSYYLYRGNHIYPFYTLENQTQQNIEILMSIEEDDPWVKYKNIQFILHLTNILGKKDVQLFLTAFFQDPDFFLNEKIKQWKKNNFKVINQFISH